jgi:hypothetical protein
MAPSIRTLEVASELGMGLNARATSLLLPALVRGLVP